MLYFIFSFIFKIIYFLFIILKLNNIFETIWKKKIALVETIKIIDNNIEKGWTIKDIIENGGISVDVVYLYALKSEIKYHYKNCIFFDKIIQTVINSFIIYIYSGI